MNLDFQCYSCNKLVKKSERYERAFEIFKVDKNGKKNKEIINAFACSTKCLHEWYENQNKWVQSEEKEKYAPRMLNMGCGY